MIVKNNQTIGGVFKGTTEIEKICKGTSVVYESWKTLTASGVPPLTLLNCKGVDLLDYRTYGNSVQNGTPTPTNLIEIKSVGDKRKNLYVDIASLYTKPTNYYIAPVTLEQGATYVMSCELAGQAMTNTVIVGIAKTGTKYADFGSFYYTLHTGTSDKYYTQTFTVDSSWTAPKLAIYASSQEQIAQIFENYHIQLEKSSTKTSYEPYGYKIPITVSDGTNSTTTNIYLKEPLRKLGNAIDYIDFETQKVVRYVKNLEPSGIIVNFTNGSQYANGSCRCQFGNLENNVDFAIPPMSNGSVGNVENIISSPNNVTAAARYSSFYWYFDATDVGLTPVTSTTSSSTIGTAIKNYITNNNINLQYAMVQPTEESITLPNIPSFKSTAIYSVDTNTQPSNMYVKYKGK